MVRPSLLDPAFPEQTRFVTDPARLKVLLCTRRAGKSFGIARDLLEEGFQSPGVNLLYIGLTLKSAKKAIWKDGLKKLDAMYGLNVKFNETDVTATLPNGSVIYVLGMDSDKRQQDKALGGQYKKVYVDEAQSFTIDLEELVFSTLKPAVADHRGTITLSGTPGDLKRGLFYQLTKGQDPQSPGQWSMMPNPDKPGEWIPGGDPALGAFGGHRWATIHNPYMKEQILAEIKEAEYRNPRFRETPSFQRNYLGRWVTDDTKFVYRFDRARNTYKGPLPEIVGRGRWHYVLGCDLGFEDPTAWTVSAYHDNDLRLFFVESFKKEHLDITAVADETHKLKARYDFDIEIIDGANKQAVEELNNRHGLRFIAADKAGKSDFIELMNADFISERVLLNEENCQGLMEEYAGLIWDERSTKREEHPASPNNECDSSLYNWRYCYQYLSQREELPATPGTPTWYAEQEQAIQDQIAKRIRDERQGQEDDGWMM